VKALGYCGVFKLRRKVKYEIGGKGGYRTPVLYLIRHGFTSYTLLYLSLFTSPVLKLDRYKYRPWPIKLS
jgi:hypothetical protein